MQGKTHLLAGILIGLVLLFEQQTILGKLLVFSFAIVGSLFPDIDIATSTLGRKTKLIGYIFSHRGFFHSFVLALLLFIIIAELLTLAIALPFFLGMISHLLLDMLSKEGLYLWPLRKKFSGTIVVGGFLERILQLLLIILILLLFLI